MFRLFTPFALAALLVAAGGSPAQDAKKDAGPGGLWVREVGGVVTKIDFTGGKGAMKASMFKGDDGVLNTCKVTHKDGVVTGEVTAVDVKGTFSNPPTVGFKFHFTWAAKGDTAELSELGDDFDPAVKPLIEGEYKRAKAKK